jgi:RNA methyltransferase, TrmH family
MPKPETITSAANPLVKETRKAIVRGTLTAGGCCVAETFHLLDEALRSGCAVEAVIAAESALAAVEAHLRRHRGTRVVVLPDPLFQGLSGTEASQGVMALVQPRVWTLDRLFDGCPLLVVLDGLQDPGNAGTIARTAEAFGATGMLFLKGTVNPYNPKALRAAAGSLFRLPFVHGLDAAAACVAIRQAGVVLYAGVPARPDAPARFVEEVDLTARCGLIVGSEGSGVGETLRAAALDVSIPTAGVESLNAAVAAGILLYEARRQRSRRL